MKPEEKDVNPGDQEELRHPVLILLFPGVSEHVLHHPEALTLQSYPHRL